MLVKLFYFPEMEEFYPFNDFTFNVIILKKYCILLQDIKVMN